MKRTDGKVVDRIRLLHSEGMTVRAIQAQLLSEGYKISVGCIHAYVKRGKGLEN